MGDPPFSRLDLISCRNVLIYLESPLQKRIIPMFHYALNPTGFLVLGTSESVGTFSDLRIRGDGPVRGVDLKVLPVNLPGMGECCFLVLFEEARPSRGEPAMGAGPAGGPSFGEESRPRSWSKRFSGWARRAEEPGAGLTPPDDRDREIVELRRELDAAREQHQSTIEQQDATHEELKSANEEILSSNEELQSTNEELETAKEELQSVNEELTTVNDQLQNRNVELNRLNDDLVNFLVSGNVPMVVVGVDLRIRRFTPAAGKVLNMLPTDVGRPVGDLRPPVEVPDLEDLLGKVIETVRITEREVRDRAGRWYQLRLHPYRTADHKIDGVVMVLFDIDEAKRAHERERYRLIVESSTGYGIFTFDTQGVITTWNLGAERILGYAEAEILGKKLEVIFTPEDCEAGQPEFMMRKAAADGQALDERWHVRKGGEKFWANGLVMPLKDDAGETRGYLKILRDMTDRRRLENALKEQTADLQEADRRKNEFLAMLAHELRNPLAAINSALQLSILASHDADSVTWSREVIQRQVKNLSRLVDDLLDVSRITLGKVQLRVEPLELGPVITRAVASVRQLMDERQHELSVALPQEPVCLDADPTRLEQVVVNLLNNAAKYTEPGGRIGIEVERQSHEVVITVRDTGIGIPPAMLTRVFDMFIQVDRSSARSMDGLGIGLALVRSIAEMHGGSVSATSTPGEGSNFSVHLPLAEVTPERLPRADVEIRGEGDPARVLVVDDNEDLAQSTAQVLELSGHEVKTAHDGRSAIAAARACRPDVILLDIGLPGMDGYDVAGLLRQESELKNTVIIAVSGYGEEVDPGRSRAGRVRPLSRQARRLRHPHGVDRGVDLIDSNGKIEVA